MKKQIFLFTFFLCVSSGLDAQLFCPDDITVSCLSDLTPDECGMATVVSGNYHPSMVKYVDQDETNACNEGIVYRKFYLDTDYSNTYTDNEPSCIQTISMLYTNLPLNIKYPTDKEYTCLDDVPVESPTWLHNPCDLVGYTYEDEVFEFEEGACLKIVRTFKIINWCVYDLNASDGLYTGIQIIKIVDKLAPELSDCEDQYFDTDQNCEAFVTLTNSATDLGDCPSGTLTWRVSIDLWADGTDDLYYGPNEPNPFRLDPVGNGDQIEIVIPEALSISKHKVVWKVTDGCGNVKTCSNEFFIEDNKPPTPYCLAFTSAALNGADDGQIIIPASLFNVDRVDNCSAKEDIILSFSENVEDTEKIIECGDTGFQFFRIYHTDQAGNQDFCEVFMLIFDNGTCFGKFAPKGFISKPNGTSIEGASAYLMDDEAIISLVESDDFGIFSFGSQDLMEKYNAVVKYEESDMEDIDIEDFVLMRSALLGLGELNFYQKVAADLNHDNSFDIDDLFEFRDILLGNTEIANDEAWKFIPKMHTFSNSQTNLEISNSIPYTAYGEGFDYYGVKTGDLTGSTYEIENISQSDDNVALTLKISNSEISILANESIQTDAFQFDFTMNNLQSGEDNFNEKMNRYTNLKASNALQSKEALFSAEGNFIGINEIEKLIASAKVYRSGSLSPSSINWTISDERNVSLDFEKEATPIVYPLPMDNQLTVEATGILNLSLYNMAGDKIEVVTSILENSAVIKTTNTLPRGIYMLRITSDGNDKIVKIVK